MGGFEKSYLNVLEKTFFEGVNKDDRTGTGSRSTFTAENIQVSLNHVGVYGENLGYQIPVLTTKKVFLKGIIHELIWMISGSTNVYYLQRNGVHIWDDWVKKTAYDYFMNWRNKNLDHDLIASSEIKYVLKKVLKKENITEPKEKYADYIYYDVMQRIHENHKLIPNWEKDKKELGELGPVYGSQWRRWEDTRITELGGNIANGLNTWEYVHVQRRVNSEVIYTKYIDQIKRLEYELVSNPFSRRHILTAWNVGKVDEMALPPCHTLAQFYVAERDGKKYLSSKLYARSQDLFLGTPFNMVFYSMLTILLAEVHGFIPENYIHVFGDAHVYKNHENQVLRQLEREILDLPVGVKLKRKVSSVTELTAEDIEITGWEEYLENCHPTISAPVAV